MKNLTNSGPNVNHCSICAKSMDFWDRLTQSIAGEIGLQLSNGAEIEA